MDSTATASSFGHAPHEVTFHYRVSRLVDVSPYWLGKPDAYFGTSFKLGAVPFGFPTDHPAKSASQLA
jgi:hypothetical protein